MKEALKSGQGGLSGFQAEMDEAFRLSGQMFLWFEKLPVYQVANRLSI